MPAFRYIDYWHAEMSTNDPSKPHPHLTEPLLYITNLPTHITTPQLERLFAPYDTSDISIQQSTPKASRKGSKAKSLSATFARIEFSTISEAEKACALLHLYPFPDASPPAAVEFAFSPDTLPPTPPDGVRSRLLKGVRSTTTDAEVFHLLRRFGPIYSLGEHVHFWREEDAISAEKTVHLFYPKLTLHLYDTRMVQCTNIPREIHTVTIQALFETYGPLASVRMFKPRQIEQPKYASVAFNVERQALMARNALRNHAINGQHIRISFKPPRPSLRTVAQGSSRTSVMVSSSKSEDDDAANDTADSFNTAITGGPTSPLAISPVKSPTPTTTAVARAQSPTRRVSPAQNGTSTPPLKAIKHRPTVLHNDSFISLSLATLPPVKSPTGRSTPPRSSSPAPLPIPPPQVKASPLSNGFHFDDSQRLKQIIAELEAKSVADNLRFKQSIAELEAKSAADDLRFKQSISELEARLAEEQQIHQAEILRLDEQHDALRVQVAELSARCQSLDDDVARHETTNEELKKSHETAAAEAQASLDAAYALLETERKEHQEQSAKERELQDGLKETVLRQQDMLSDVRQAGNLKYEMLQQAKETLEEDLRNMSSQNNDLRRRLEAADMEKNAAFASLHASDAAANHLTAELAELEGRFSDYGGELEMTRQLLEDMRMEASQHAMALDHALEAGEALCVEVEELKSQIQRHRCPVPPPPPPPPSPPESEPTMEVPESEPEPATTERTQTPPAVASPSAVELEQSYAEITALQKEVEDLRQRLSISESHRKLLELSEAQRLQEAKEREEEEALEAQRRLEVEASLERMRQMAAEEEESKRAAEAARVAQVAARLAQEAAIRRREEEARLVLERAEQERQERIRLENLARNQAWKDATQREIQRCWERHMQLRGTVWTEERVLPWFVAMLTDFETIKFSTAQPLTVGAVPWPVRFDPAEFAMDFVEWSEVENFFQWLDIYTRRRPGLGNEYRSILERVHRAFHPDRWSSRGLLSTVMDEDTRKSMERCGNLVSQAVTPIWSKSRASR